MQPMSISLVSVRVSDPMEAQEAPLTRQDNICKNQQQHFEVRNRSAQIDRGVAGQTVQVHCKALPPFTLPPLLHPMVPEASNEKTDIVKWHNGQDLAKPMLNRTEARTAKQNQPRQPPERRNSNKKETVSLNSFLF